MSEEITIQDKKMVWVAWTNTDCTEGRGAQIPLVVCQEKATAVRLGKGKSVQGSDCAVAQHEAVRLGNCWLVPGEIKVPTKEDIKEQKRLDAIESAIERAKEAGLTDEDIKLLSLRE